MSELTRHPAYREPFVISGSPFTAREVRRPPLPGPLPRFAGARGDGIHESPRCRGSRGIRGVRGAGVRPFGEPPLPPQRGGRGPG